MKTFLINLGLFLAVCLSLFLLKFGLLTYANNRQLANFQVDPTVESVSVGDSHIQLAIDDRLLANNINLSQPGDPFNYSLLKIKMILQKKPSIKRIYLGFSYHSLSSYYDDYISGKYASGIAARYLFILPTPDKVAVIRQNSHDLTTLLRMAFISGLGNLRVSYKRFSFLGYYNNAYKATKATKKQIDRRVAEQFYDHGQLRDFSGANSAYLNTIIELCKRQGVELVILNTPLHPYYKRSVPPKFIEKYNTFIAQNKLRVLDLSDLPLSDSCYTADGDHVSEKGAVRTTNRLLMTESVDATKLVQR